MQYTKPMIELVYEIRRLAPSEIKPAIKLANPELFNELITHYHGNAKTVAKALIKELLTLAGSDWSKALEKATKVEEKHHTKMYRGTISLEESQKKQADTAQKKKRVYRGQVIA